MNERIRQLAEQANEAFSQQVGEHGSYYFNDFAEKFAELIVRECGQWIVDNAGAMEHLGPEYFAQAMIKKNFGVEE
jgi:hypothetical protein